MRLLLFCVSLEWFGCSAFGTKPPSSPWMLPEGLYACEGDAPADSLVMRGAIPIQCYPDKGP